MKPKTLAELLEAATPGEWIADNNEGFGQNKIWAGHAPSGASPIGKEVAIVIGDSAETEANAELLCRLKNSAPAEAEVKGLFNGGKGISAPPGTNPDYWRIFVEAQREALAALNGHLQLTEGQ